MGGEYSGPMKVLDVDLATGRARDVSVEFAKEVIEWVRLDDLPSD